MGDVLDTLAQEAIERVDAGYYNAPDRGHGPPLSLKAAIQECTAAPVITEVKAASPALGTIRTNFDPADVASAMERGGATGISVLTVPQRFGGSLTALVRIRESVRLPLLMKDFLISPKQIETASLIGADVVVVLLIQALYDRGYGECELERMIMYAHSRGMEVLLETHTRNEFLSAMTLSADMVGINNRDLRTLKVDLNVTNQVLSAGRPPGLVLVAESGINTAHDIRSLRDRGVDAFLVGSAIMSTHAIEKKVWELVQAYGLG
jgi:indole-3-glycerol phosphate synthase